MCSVQLFSVSFGITSKSSPQLHLPPSLFFSKWTSCGPSFQSHERTLGDNWAGQTCHSWKKEAFVWPWRDIFRVAFCFGDVELDMGFPLNLPLSMGPITWQVFRWFSGWSHTHAPGPAIFRITARWLLKNMDTGGAARSPSRGGLWCSAVKISAHRSQVFQSVFSLVLTGSYRPCSRQPPPPPHNTSCPCLS